MESARIGLLCGLKQVLSTVAGKPQILGDLCRKERFFGLNCHVAAAYPNIVARYAPNILDGTT
jgi:hypothetical protein